MQPGKSQISVHIPAGNVLRQNVTFDWCLASTMLFFSGVFSRKMLFLNVTPYGCSSSEM